MVLWMTFSISRDRQLYLLKAIFRPWCMALVGITVKVRVSVKSLGVRVRLKVSVSRVRRRREEYLFRQ